jgi:hypothetical protein
MFTFKISSYLARYIDYVLLPGSSDTPGSLYRSHNSESEELHRNATVVLSRNPPSGNGANATYDILI